MRTKATKKRRSKPKKAAYLKVLGVNESGQPTAEYFRTSGRRKVRVTSREFYDSAPDVRALERKQGGRRGQGVVPGAGHCWPLKCEALACHKSQVEGFRKAYKERGVNVEVRKDGMLIVPDEGAYRRLRKVHGAFHRNSFNG